jgi:precorrin-8X/cobalt-precorrin-8 methylmutase
MVHITDPKAIENTSMDIIDGLLAYKRWDDKLYPIVKRVVHTTADPAFAELLEASRDAVDAGIEALKKGCVIITDTRMAQAGINKKRLQKLNCEVQCGIDDPSIEVMAMHEGITRAAAAIRAQSALAPRAIFAIGNAPTALYELGELIEGDKVQPYLVIGVPIGFVGAADSKEYIKTLGTPFIVINGPKGGSNIAAAIVNALLIEAMGNNIG